ncbi:MAG: septum formation initiator family protein [Mariprofundaceae bacterium]
MAYDLLLSDHGYRVYQIEKKEMENIKAELDALKLKRETLAKEILRLRKDPKALEALVHRELGYVYPDEFMVILPENSLKNGKRPEENR